MTKNRGSEHGIGSADPQLPPLGDGTDCTAWCERLHYPLLPFGAESKLQHEGSQ